MICDMLRLCPNVPPHDRNPPIHRRVSGKRLLAGVFIDRYTKKIGKQITSIQRETMKALQDYEWPGNVRELESISERAVILCHGPVLHLTDKLVFIPSPVIRNENYERDGARPDT